MDKSLQNFPIKKEFAYFSHCFVGPLLPVALNSISLVNASQLERGYGAFSEHKDVMPRFRESLASLLNANAADISFIPNTAYALNLIASGYPFLAGDEIIIYELEYPSNVFPWILQEGRGVIVRKVSSLNEIIEAVTDRTRVIALSHVQFLCGQPSDLNHLSTFCHEHRIDLILDAAQSLGVMPLDVRSLKGVSAVAASGWKWLLGPVGCGVLYTRTDFRHRLKITHGGGDMMQQGNNYLDHSLNPHTDGRFFEASTGAFSLAAALATNVENFHLKIGIEAIFTEVIRLQDYFLKEASSLDLQPVLDLSSMNRSSILSLSSNKDLDSIAKKLEQSGIMVTVRGSMKRYLRFAPHWYNDEKEIDYLVEVLLEGKDAFIAD
jgi:selenocysteine lyase/cysteine desulfurase